MKTDYKVRAEKFAHVLVKLFEDCEDVNDFYQAVSEYKRSHRCAMKIDNGVSRVAIMRSDYVIKFHRRQDFRDFAGDSYSERKVYEKAVADGYEYLLAETTLMNVDGVEVAIMPRIRHVGNTNFWGCTTPKERAWIRENIDDLHSGNFGRRGKKICIIDYAWAC
jgi:hypothetical protein